MGENILEGKLLNMNAFLDEDDLMRVGGRMANAIDLNYNERFPILLPTASRFSYLLIDFIHRLTLQII